MTESPTTLGKISELVSDKIQLSELDVDTYVSTDNMLPNLGGIETASGLPSADKTRVFKKGDVLFSNIRTYFKKVWFANFDGGCSNDVLVFRGNENVDSRFLYYVLADDNFIDFTVTTSKGTKMPRGDKDAMKQYALNLPSLPEQKAIAHILGKLDDKIQLNRKMNQTLEAMAQALFKSWFVDFDPVLDNALAAGNEIPEALKAKAEKRLNSPSRLEGVPAGRGSSLLHTNPTLAKLFPSSFEYNETLDKWVPEGWEVKKLEEIVSVKYGKDHKKLNEGIIPCYGSGGVMRLVEKSLYDKESVLIPRKGTLNNIIYINAPFWSVDTMFYTVMERVDIAKYFYYTMKRLNFAEMNEGSAVPSMTTAQLNSMDIIVPNDECLSWFDKTIANFFAKMEGNVQENETLTKLRDTLLPQLISGKVRVPEVTLKNNTN